MPKRFAPTALFFRGSESELQKLVDVIPAAVVVAGQDGRIHAVNELAVALFGRPREELLGANFESLVPERLRSGHARHVAGYFASPRVRLMGIGLNLAAARNDGSEFAIEVGLSPVEVDGTIFAMGVIVDATGSTRPNAPGSAQDIVVSGRAAVAGNAYGLTLREYAVLCLVSTGLSDKQIAIELMISPQTVHKHVGNILGKMQVGSRTEAATRAFREGLLIERETGSK